MSSIVTIPAQITEVPSLSEVWTIHLYQQSFMPTQSRAQAANSMVATFACSNLDSDCLLLIKPGTTHLTWDDERSLLGPSNVPDETKSKWLLDRAVGQRPFLTVRRENSEVHTE